MTASHPGPGTGPPDIVADGNWRGHRDRPASLTGAPHLGEPGDDVPDIVTSGNWLDRPAGLILPWRRIVAIAGAVVVLVAGWSARDYIMGSWRYLAEHRSPLAPGLLCPTLPGQAMPGPGLLATITDLGRGVPPSAVANQYGCAPASSFVEPEPSAPLPRSQRIPRGAA